MLLRSRLVVDLWHVDGAPRFVKPREKPVEVRNAQILERLSLAPAMEFGKCFPAGNGMHGCVTQRFG